jgi:hypothetical protein
LSIGSLLKSNAACRQFFDLISGNLLPTGGV